MSEATQDIHQVNQEVPRGKVQVPQSRTLLLKDILHLQMEVERLAYTAKNAIQYMSQEEVYLLEILINLTKPKPIANISAPKLNQEPAKEEAPNE